MVFLTSKSTGARNLFLSLFNMLLAESMFTLTEGKLMLEMALSSLSMMGIMRPVGGPIFLFQTNPASVLLGTQHLRDSFILMEAHSLLDLALE